MGEQVGYLHCLLLIRPPPMIGEFLFWETGVLFMSAPGSLVMEHACNPRNGGAMEQADAIGEASLDGRAPRLKIFLRVADQVVVQAMFQTFGCGYSIACCSVLTELATGKTLGECLTITWQDVSDALGGLPEERVFCAPLAIKALQAAVQKYQAERSPKSA